MPISERTERAIEACYDAIVMPMRWGQALQSLAESLDAVSCAFCTHAPDETPFKVPVSTAHEEFADLWIRNEPHAPDPHNERGPAFGRQGHSFIIEHQISTEEERRTLPYYTETARPGKRDWWAATCFPVGGRSWCLPLFRGADQGAFTFEEACAFTAVGPHLARLVGLAEKFAEVNATSGLAVLEHMSCAALLVDASGVARYLNRPAQQLLGEAFNLVRGRPVASDRASNRRLQHLVLAALRVERNRAPANAPVVVDREGAPWLLVEAMPVTAFGSDYFSAGRTILLLTDLTSTPRPDASLLSIVFGLTLAEAKLAARLASGGGLDHAAVSLGVSRETARSQLKAVFAKTGTRRQAELSALLASLRPPASQSPAAHNA